MVSYTQSLEDLYLKHRHSHDWRSGPINLTVATSLVNDEPQLINISDTIGKGKNCPNQSNRTSSNCYWLQSHYNENTDTFRQQQIHPLFVRACHQDGFILKGNYEPKQQAITFRCRRGKYHDEEYGRVFRESRPRQVKQPDLPPVPRDRRTQLPKKKRGDTSCKFHFTVYWCAKKKRWFIPMQQQGCLDHCGQMKIEPKELRIQSRFVQREEIEVSKDALGVKIPSTATASLLHKRTGLSLEWHQLPMPQCSNTDIHWEDPIGPGMDK